MTDAAEASKGSPSRMTRHQFLLDVHRQLLPRSYLEIGVSKGGSLALSRTRTIAVDPAFKITSEIHCDLKLVQATSDDFFAREDALAHLPEGRADLAFIDGFHLLEFALRDFMNVERHALWTTAIAVDDVLPRNVAEASRERGDMVAWAGDVFKLAEILTRYRPDLLVLQLDTIPTGVLLVLGADAENRVLETHYDEIVAEFVYPDPQRVPEALLRRETAIDPFSIAGSGVWRELRTARDSGLTREARWEPVRRSTEEAARPAELRELPLPKTRGGAPPTPARKPRATVRRGLRGLRRRVHRLRMRRT